MYILLQKTISNILKNNMFSFKINVGTSHFPKSRTYNCVCDTLNKYDILKIVSAFFQITDFCWDMHRFPCQNTNCPTFPEHICWNLCMAQPKKIYLKKMHSHCPESHIFQSVTYIVTCSCFWKCDVHKLLLEMNMLFERGPFFLILKQIYHFSDDVN